MGDPGRCNNLLAVSRERICDKNNREIILVRTMHFIMRTSRQSLPFTLTTGYMKFAKYTEKKRKRVKSYRKLQAST